MLAPLFSGSSAAAEFCVLSWKQLQQPVLATGLSDHEWDATALSFVPRRVNNAMKTAMSSRTRLPIALTSFIGRERELARTRDLVRAYRLVTFTGVGGSGKTRLALELTRAVERQFRGGAALVELAPLADPAFIGQVVAQAVGLVEPSGPDMEAVLVGALRDTELLMVLDNCEHLIGSCASLVERLLDACPQLRILATSREPLMIPGEAVFSVPALITPVLDQLSHPSALADHEAVRLFVDRAAAARPSFTLDSPNTLTVARICSHLDGLPLAIELAAARVRSLSLDDILQRLDHRFSLLSRGARTATPRHQTLHATIDWSYDLLAEDERVLFRWLAVFAGGWRLADAEAVCADARLPREAIVDVHARVVDKSLIVAEPVTAGPGRYRLLETIREYAAERLADSGERDGLRRRHFSYFLALAERYFAERMTRGSDAGLPALAAHRDNFRAALAWGAEADPEGALRLASALDDFWRMISATEGWGWLQRTLHAVPEESPYRMRAYLTAGMLAAYVPAYAEGAGLLRRVVATARHTGDRSSEAWAELWLGRLAFFGGDPDRAETHLHSALNLHEQIDSPLGRVRSLALLGLLEAVILDRRTDGEQKLQAAADLAHEIHDSWGEGYSHMMLGISAADAGDGERTRQHCTVALHTPSLGPLLGVPLQQLARVSVEDDPGRALRLMGSADGHFDRTGTVEPPFLTRRADAVRRRAAELLGDRTTTQRLNEGRAMSLDEAIAFATAELAAARPRNPGGLTQREMQVAALVGRHQTNRAIASILVISVRTAESHVEHILAKLGLSNRLELAAWARGHDLVAHEENP